MTSRTMTTKYIVVQTAFLGDVLLTLPLCGAIKRMDPTAHVVLVTTPAACEFVKGLPVVDEVVAFDKRGQHRSRASRKTFASSLNAHANTVVIVPHKSVRSMLLVRSMKAQRIVTYSDAATRWIATDVVPYPLHMLDARRHLALLNPLGAEKYTLESLVPISLQSHADESWANVEMRADTGPIVALAPGAAWPTKRWPIAYFRALASKLVQSGAQVVIVGDSSVQGAMDGISGVIDLAGKTTLRQAAAIIARSNVVISNDSAPVHLASLQHVPVVALFGPTVPEFGFAPFGPNVQVIERANLACRPCSAHGSERCPLGTHVCMTKISVDTVFDSVHHFIHAHDENRNASAKTTTSSQEDFPH